MMHPCVRRTDGQAIAYSRYSIYAVERKKRAKKLSESVTKMVKGKVVNEVQSQVIAES